MTHPADIHPADISVDEEKDLVESTERGEWVSVGLTDERREFWKSAARSVIDGKRRRISIAVPERDLARLKTRAAEEGMPYQTLINSIIHKYLQGK
ncbi:DNA-binding protein [Aquibium carbonis]|uniref:DNA-binding protein n=1 Tax=Aquibium carbonis TaxID=2495581 RepID=A0A429Z0Z3_9HYPH|nr:DNA-binding protein [Aquibium carbonis]RST87381.1 DNA-binding protein [Aquibium carbonis]